MDPEPPPLHGSNSIKLKEPLAERVTRAMKVEGITVFAEFARAALTDRCRKVESELLRMNPEEYRRIYHDQL